MVLVRMIAPEWLQKKYPATPKVLEGLYELSEIQVINTKGYNVYTFPNRPTEYTPEANVSGPQIDLFEYVFVDFDLKSNTYSSKEAFLEALSTFELLPTRIVDSGNGIHAYWKVLDLSALSYLCLTKRLIQKFNTDPATSMICQLMRLPGTMNTKIENTPLECTVLYEDPVEYTCEQLDKVLPIITLDNEKKAKDHFDKTYNIDRQNLKIEDVMPAKFGKLLSTNHEAKELWSGDMSDRSKNDYRLGHLMFANQFTRDEAATVLANSAKALQRAPVHRVSYAQNIIDKIWTYELEDQLGLSESIEEILKKSETSLKGTPFRCDPIIDNTAHGFRLGQVIGLVAGSGVGKTSFALNMFKWFVKNNPDYHHFFIPLEQPSNEIADRWKTMCGDETNLHKKVHVLSNYDKDGNFRHLSFDEIRDYIQKWQTQTNNKIGCIVIDHIGALKKKGAKDENQDLMTICHSMKAFAVQTNTLLVMQSQSNRSKAGIGDLELDKDAAYGTVFFEAYCDYLITLWQPLKRCHNEEGCPTITAFKYCKIRHKKPKLDVIQEDVPYYLFFDSEKELLRNLMHDEKISFSYFLNRAISIRKADKKTDIIKYQSVPTGETSDRLNSH